MVALKFYMQYLYCGISTSAANAIKRKNTPSAVKVALATPSPSRVMFEAGGATTTWSIAETYSARASIF